MFLKDQMTSRKSGGNLPPCGGENEEDWNEADLQQTGQLVPTEDVVEDRDAYEVQSMAQANAQPISIRSGKRTTDHEDENRNEYEDQFVTQAVAQPTIHPIRSGKRGAQQQLLDIKARKLRLLEKKVDKSTTKDEDEDEAFFKSILPHVKKLKPEDKLVFRMEIQSVVQKHVYGKPKRTQIMQNSTPLHTNVEIRTPQPSCSYQRTPSRQQTPSVSIEYDDQDEDNGNTMTTTAYSPMITAERQYYSVITSPISSVETQQ